MAERVRERNSKSRTTAKPSPPPAVVRRTILEFEFLSRIIASMQSMRWCRHDPAAVSCAFEPGQELSARISLAHPMSGLCSVRSVRQFRRRWRLADRPASRSDFFLDNSLTFRSNPFLICPILNWLINGNRYGQAKWQSARRHSPREAQGMAARLVVLSPVRRRSRGK
jgi:hypothetical protein